MLALPESDVATSSPEEDGHEDDETAHDNEKDGHGDICRPRCVGSLRHVGRHDSAKDRYDAPPRRPVDLAASKTPLAWLNTKKKSLTMNKTRRKYPQLNLNVIN